jgi:hypothetical protein
VKLREIKFNDVLEIQKILQQELNGITKEEHPPMAETLSLVY